MRIRVGHLYPDYLNIYADAAKSRCCRTSRMRGPRARVSAIGLHDPVRSAR